MRLSVLAGRYAVCRLDPDAEVDPRWWAGSELAVVARAPGELSLVCREETAPPEVPREAGFRALGVVGPLDFALVGVLADLTRTLAQAEVSVFAISTYDTDYLLVREEALELAVAALRDAGHTISEPGVS